jgi:hypothetical protein
MHPQGHRKQPGLAVVALLAVCTIALAACTSNRVDDVEAKPTKGRNLVSASLAPEDKAKVDEVWTAYLKLNAIYVKAAQTGTYDWNPDPAKRPMYDFAAGKLLAELERDLDFMSEQGVIRTGDPVVTLRRVVSVSPTSILIETCVDDTNTDSIDKTTRKSVAAPGQNKKYPVTLRAGLYPDGLWRWVESHPDRAATC